MAAAQGHAARDPDARPRTRHLDELRDAHGRAASDDILARLPHRPATSARSAPRGAVVFSPTPDPRLPRLLRATTRRWGHAHWLYQHNGGVFLPPWGKCEQWTLSVQHTDDDVDGSCAQPRARSPRPARLTTAGPTVADGRSTPLLGKVGLPGAGRRARGDGRGTRSSSAAATTGSTAAAYLAKAGKSVLVLESARAARRRVHARATRSPTPATRSARAPTSSACSTSG